MPLISIGADDYPAFADVDFADSFLAGDVMRAALWAARADENTKARGLVSATRMLLQIPWAVVPLPDPEAAIEDINETIKEATAMLAADLLAKPRLFSDATGNSNVKIARAGSASVEFFKPVADGPPIPSAIWRMLVNAGLVGAIDNDELPGAFVSGLGGNCRPLGGRRDWNCTEQDYD